MRHVGRFCVPWCRVVFDTQLHLAGLSGHRYEYSFRFDRFRFHILLMTEEHRALKVEKFIDILERELLKPVPLPESLDDLLEYRIAPQVILTEAVEASMIHEMAQVRVNAGVEDGVCVWIVPGAVFCGK